MPGRGKLIVLGMLLLAVALAVANMLFQTRVAGRAVAYWGDEAARLILTASQVELLRLGPAASGTRGSAEVLRVAETDLAIQQQFDLSQATGMLHFRRALITDKLYDWESSPATPGWRYAVRFRQDEREFTLLIAGDFFSVGRSDVVRPLAVCPNDQGVSPLQAFLEEKLAAAAHRSGATPEASGR